MILFLTYGNDGGKSKNIMKKYVITLFTFLLAYSVYAKEDVIEFLGIPVDGSKTEVMNQIKAKGFNLMELGNMKVLNGRFNDTDVYINAQTNGDKVYRLVILDAQPMSESMIKIRYNNLCHQFVNNPKYISGEDPSIPENENISFEMKVHGKEYQAIFFQLPSESGITYEKVLAEVKSLEEAGTFNNLSENEKYEECKKIFEKRLLEVSSNRPVWFTITEAGFNEYQIMMFYENRYNLS
ncbi:MAG: hypothetical protein K2M71_03610, partial [Duncaniella sp.]|nr:hypothetical protein [Duncaniella sp.]